MKRNVTISLLLGGALSALTLYFAFKNVPFGDLFRYLGSINYFWVIPSVMLGLLAFVLRVMRWQILLASVRPVGYGQAFHPMMIGFMLNCILPGRVGEVARPLILQKQQRVPFTTGLATVATERVLDASLLIVFFALLLANIEIDPGLSISYGDYRLNRQLLETVSSGMLKLSLLLIAGILMVSIDRTRRMIIGLTLKLPGLFSWAGDRFRSFLNDRICGPVVRIVENVAVGFQMLKRPRPFVLCLALTVAVWLLSAASYYVMAFGCPGIELSFLELSAVMIIICFFIAIPSVPGFWGVWEAGGVFALTIFGVPASEAAGFTLANHAIQMLPVIGVGFFSAIYTGIDIWRITREIGTPAAAGSTEGDDRSRGKGGS